MARRKRHAALLVGIVLLAGCSGGPGPTDDPQSTNATATPPTSATAPPTPYSATAAVAQPIAVVNNRSVPYRVSFYVMNEANPVLNVTFANGTTVTRPVNESDALVQSVPFVHSGGSSVEPVRNITAMAPAERPDVAMWSAVVQPESAVSLPTPVEWGNVTLLVVVEMTGADRPWVYTTAMYRCESPRTAFGEFRLTLPTDRNVVRGSTSCA